MKNLFCVFAVVILCQAASAQIQKGKVLFGVGAKLSGGSYTARAELALPLGVFVSDKWLLGITPGFEKQFNTSGVTSPQNNYSLEASPFISRFWGINEKWYFSLQTSLVFKKEIIEYNDNFQFDGGVMVRSIYNTLGLSLSPGINYLISPRVLVNFQIDALSLLNTGPGNSSLAPYSNYWSFGINQSTSSGALTSLRFIF